LVCAQYTALHLHRDSIVWLLSLLIRMRALGVVCIARRLCSSMQLDRAIHFCWWLQTSFSYADPMSLHVRLID
jgi:hypothetical protein